MEDRYLPSSRTAVHVNTAGAVIVDIGGDDDDGSPSELHHQHQREGRDSRDSRDIYLPKHTEWISHIAVDIGGSLCKVVYFSRALHGHGHGHGANGAGSNGSGKGKGRDLDGSSSSSNGWDGPLSPRQPRTPLHMHTPSTSRPASPGRSTPVPNGVLGPESVVSAAGIKSYFDSMHTTGEEDPHNGHALPSRRESGSRSRRPPATAELPTGEHEQSRQSHMLSRAGRRSNSFSAPIPGGWLNFTKFETGDIESCIDFLNQLIEASSASHNIPSSDFKAKHVKIMATGGGAHLFHDRLSRELGVEVRKEEEMECLIAGLTFFMQIPHEVFWYSDQLVHYAHNPSTCSFTLNSSVPSPAASLPSDSTLGISNDELPRPSPNPPQYSLVFDDNPSPQFPCMLVNIGSGVSIIKVDDNGQFERISGTSLGGGTLWGLLSMLTGAESFDEMLALSEAGDNANVDMLVGDIYGSDYSKIGLKSSTIASSFGKVFRKGNKAKTFKPEDIAKSLLYAVSNNIGQIAYMNAEKHNLDRIYFGGCFIRGHAATISTLSYAIRFWSKGTKKALFLRHEGYLGSIGAWLRNIEEEERRR